MIAILFSFLSPGMDYFINDTEFAFIFTPTDDSFEIPVIILDDQILESNEDFQLTLSTPTNPPSGLQILSTASSATIRIIDNEGLNQISIHMHAINLNKVMIIRLDSS